MVANLGKSQVNKIGMGMILISPLDLEVATEPSANAEILICTYQAGHILYLNYTVAGLNVVMLSILPRFFLVPIC